MNRLFVRSGGGMPGLDIHAGIWRALEVSGIRATVCTGTSAGALVSAMDAADWTARRAEEFLSGLTDEAIRSERPAWRLRMPWIDSFLRHEPIQDLLRRHLPEKFTDLAKPLQVCCTQVKDGGKMTFSAAHGNPWLREAVLASMSISGVFPWVGIGGEWYADGGVRANLPLPENWRDYDEVWLLIATRPTFYRTQNRGLLSRMILNMDWLMADQIYDVLATVERAPRVRVVWPDCGKTSGTLHFDHGLIDIAFADTLRILGRLEAPIADGR